MSRAPPSRDLAALAVSAVRGGIVIDPWRRSEAMALRDAQLHVRIVTVERQRMKCPRERCVRVITPGATVLLDHCKNPPGDDTQNEEATLKNFGGQPTSVIGWRLRDLSGRTWTLDALGTLQPGEEKTVRRQGQPMALTNRGDTIDLVDASGLVVQTVTYGPVATGGAGSRGELTPGRWDPRPDREAPGIAGGLMTGGERAGRVTNLVVCYGSLGRSSLTE